jgi:hypothetical protein
LSGNLINLDEAWKLQQTISDLTTRQLVASALTHAALLFSQEDAEHDLDLKFFAEIMIKFSSNHQYLKAILRGEDLRWFPEDDEIIAPEENQG